MLKFTPLLDDNQDKNPINWRSVWLQRLLVSLLFYLMCHMLRKKAKCTFYTWSVIPSINQTDYTSSFGGKESNFLIK